jgi:D-arabinose 1-dehydrogenase-like Zn-dependent alcohol dehydrogenase
MATVVHSPSKADLARTTMKAAVVHAFDQPLSIEQIPKPVAGHGEAIVKIEASGLCHTDIHAAHGDWPIKPQPPFVPGHEGVGIVESVGPGVELAIGQRIAVPWSAAHAGTASTASRAGRRSASDSTTRATRWTAASRSTSRHRPPTPSLSRTGSIPSMPLRSRAQE